MSSDTEPRPAALRPGVVTLRCPSCAGTVAIRAPGQTVTVSCQSCGSLLDVNGAEVADVVKYEMQRRRPTPAIGTRGTFREQIFEVIGFIQQEEDGYTWDEYLLFNPRIGFRWLVFDHGHWNFSTPMPVPPALPQKAFTAETIYANSTSFRRYHLGKATVAHVEGEFYWRVRRGDTNDTCDFVAPPFMLSAERGADEINWSRLEYIEPAEIAAAFKIDPPSRQGIAANQPDPNEAHARATKKIALIALATTLVVQLFFAFTTPSNQVLRESIPSVSKDAGPIVLGPFELRGRPASMRLKSYAPLNNAWVDIDAELVNEKTEETFEFTQSLEKYSGHDSDGYWSEGSPDTSSMIASVPAGTYVLLLQPSTGASGVSQAYNGAISVELTRGVTSWSAFFTIVVALSLYPAWIWFRRRTFLVRRWANSEFTPYSSDDDDSDDSDD